MKYQTVFITESVGINEDVYDSIKSELVNSKDLKLEYDQGLFCDFFNNYLIWINGSIVTLSAIYLEKNEMCETVLWLILNVIMAFLYLGFNIPCYRYALKLRQQQLERIKLRLLASETYPEFLEEFNKTEFEDDQTTYLNMLEQA